MTAPTKKPIGGLLQSLKDGRTSFPYDLTIQCPPTSTTTDGATFEAHKFIVYSRIPYFRELMNMESFKSDVVNIDVPGYIVAPILDWIYSCEISNDFDWDKNGFNLLIAADKYRIEDLVIHCCSLLKNAVNRDNACGILDMSETLSLPTLALSALEVIHKNYADIRNTSEFEKMSNSAKQKLLDYVHHFKPVYVRPCLHMVSKGYCNKGESCKFKH